MLELVRKLVASDVLQMQNTEVVRAISKYGESVGHKELYVLPLILRQFGLGCSVQFQRLSQDLKEKSSLDPGRTAQLAARLLGWETKIQDLFEAHLYFIFDDAGRGSASLNKHDHFFDEVCGAIDSPAQFVRLSAYCSSVAAKALRQLILKEPSRVRLLQSNAAKAAEAFPDSTSLKVLSTCLRMFSNPADVAIPRTVKELKYLNVNELEIAATIITHLFNAKSHYAVLVALFRGIEQSETIAAEANWLTRMRVERTEQRISEAEQTTIFASSKSLIADILTLIPSTHPAAFVHNEAALTVVDPELSSIDGRNEVIKEYLHFSHFSHPRKNFESKLCAYLFAVSERLSRRIVSEFSEFTGTTKSAFEFSCATGLATRMLSELRPHPALSSYLKSHRSAHSIIVDDETPFSRLLLLNHGLDEQLTVLSPNGEDRTILTRKQIFGGAVAPNASLGGPLTELFVDLDEKVAFDCDRFTDFSNQRLILASLYALQYRESAEALLVPLLKEGPVTIIDCFGRSNDRVSEWTKRMQDMGSLSSHELSIEHIPPYTAKRSDLARQASITLISDYTDYWQSSYSEIFGEDAQINPRSATWAVMSFLLDDLPRLITLARNADRLFSKGKPDILINLPGRTPVENFLTLVAREKKTPTIGWEPALLAGEIGSAIPPVAEKFLTIDNYEIEAVESYADCSSTEVSAVGSTAIESISSATNSTEPHPAFQAADGRLRVLFVSQPVFPDRNIEVLQWLLSFRDRDLAIVVKTHPNDPWDFVELYGEMVAQNNDQHKASLVQDAPMASLFAGADIIVSRFSTAVYEAAVAGRSAVTFSDPEASIDLAERNLSDGFSNSDELHDLLKQASADLDGFRTRQNEKRKAYFEKNPMVGDGASSARVLEEINALINRDHD